MNATPRQPDVDAIRPYVGRHEAPPPPLTTSHEDAQARTRARVAEPFYREPRHEVRP